MLNFNTDPSYSIGSENANILDVAPFQKILGSKVKAGLKMFGISISGGVDVDKNEYPGK